jgi:ABC-type transport system substrate-binding protein
MGTRPHPDSMLRREFVTGGVFNPTGYSNPQFDSLVARARRSTNPGEQIELYQQAQKILRVDLPTLPLYSMDILGGWRPGVRGYRPHPLQYWELAETAVGKRGRA